MAIFGIAVLSGWTIDSRGPLWEPPLSCGDLSPGYIIDLFKNGLFSGSSLNFIGGL